MKSFLNFDTIVEDLRNMDYEEYNEQNFFTEANQLRYYDYLDKIVLKYCSNPDRITSRIKEKRVIERPFVGKTISTEYKVFAEVPERKILLDEMMSIHQITHLINFTNNKDQEESIYKDVIPTFNEYDYLSKIHPFYAEYYLRLVRNNAIEAARTINDSNTKDNLSYIMAYLVLEHRRHNYDIEKLNYMNAQNKRLEIKLPEKGYTL